MIGVEELILQLTERSVPPALIQKTIESGYFLRTWANPLNGAVWTSVSDQMYGNKQFSSSLNIDKFAGYVNGTFQFEKLPAFVTYRAGTFADVLEILADPRRRHYQKEGSLTFRGQPREYKFRRPVPNPLRSDDDGCEISILPGLYRQTAAGDYVFRTRPIERRSFESFVHDLEPSAEDTFLGSNYHYDVMRVEQHYATQTAGLDLTFNIEAALFFATHRFKWGGNGLAHYERVRDGEHSGVLYCFRFTDPPVKKTEYLIKDFDLFKTTPPERVLRQTCGLPLFMPEERNIAVCDIDCIIYLEPHFQHRSRLTPHYMFPPVSEDPFYGKILELKDRYPTLLSDVVEYDWARTR